MPSPVDDGEHLIGDDNEDSEHESRNRPRGCFRGQRRFFCFLTALIVILTGHVVVVYFIYFRCPPSSCTALKIMALNTWGMPATFGSRYKEDRMKAIAEEIQKAEHDVYLLEELWMRPDHKTILEKIPSGFHMTSYGSLNVDDCDGLATPGGCSGLAIVSRFPFEVLTFHKYDYSGDPVKAFVDGEWFANKGAGKVRINVLNRTVDIFVTHTAADPDPSHGYNNSYYREKQVEQLVGSFLAASNADVVLLAGDFNAGPDTSSYAMIRKQMMNCVEDVFVKWLHPNFATYANEKNTFSYGIVPPIIFDYIFHMNRRGNNTQVWTNWFELPFFKFLLLDDKEKKMLSFSDHEAVTSTVYIKEISYS